MHYEQHSAIRTEPILVTPAMAREWIHTQGVNRPVNKELVRRLSNDMAHDRWIMNGETIKFSGDRLVDGQHRLLAIIAVGRPVPLLMSRGLAGNAIDTIDTGMSRRPGDVIGVAGIPWPKMMASAARWIYAYDHEQLTGRRTLPSGISHGALLETAREMVRGAGGLEAMAEICRQSHRSRLISNQTVFCAFRYLTHRIDPGPSEKFFGQVETGEHLSESDPAFVLRRRLSQSVRIWGQRTVPTSIIERGAWFAKAWNAYRSGTPVKSLRYGYLRGKQVEQFPTLL